MELKDDEWLTISDAAKLIGRSKIQVYNAIERLPYTKRGRYYFIHKPKLLDMLQERGVDNIIPTRKADWEQFTEHLRSCGADQITLSIPEIKAISRSSSLTLHTLSEWDSNASKRTPSGYRAMVKAGYDLSQIKLNFSPEENANIIEEITFVRSKRKPPESARIGEEDTIAEQRGLHISSGSKAVVRCNGDLRTGLIHLPHCYLVPNELVQSLRGEWRDFSTVKEAEDFCIEEFGEDWKHCLRCFRKK